MFVLGVRINRAGAADAGASEHRVRWKLVVIGNHPARQLSHGLAGAHQPLVIPRGFPDSDIAFHERIGRFRVRVLQGIARSAAGNARSGKVLIEKLRRFHRHAQQPVISEICRRMRQCRRNDAAAGRAADDHPAIESIDELAKLPLALPEIRQGLGHDTGSFAPRGLHRDAKRFHDAELPDDIENRITALADEMPVSGMCLAEIAADPLAAIAAAVPEKPARADARGKQPVEIPQHVRAGFFVT